MNNKEINNQKMYQDNWSHDKYTEVNKDDKNINQGKIPKSRKPYNNFSRNDMVDNSVNNRTLQADFLEPRKQPMKKQNV